MPWNGKSSKKAVQISNLVNFLPTHPRSVFLKRSFARLVLPCFERRTRKQYDSVEKAPDQGGREDFRRKSQCWPNIGGFDSWLFGITLDHFVFLRFHRFFYKARHKLSNPDSTQPSNKFSAISIKTLSSPLIVPFHKWPNVARNLIFQPERNNFQHFSMKTVVAVASQIN